MFAKRYHQIIKSQFVASPDFFPLVYKFTLNWQCNLKCNMCMLWGDVGWRKEESVIQERKEQLDFGIIQKVINETRQDQRSFIFIGGEPLMYPRFKDLLEVLKKERIFSITCTNGLLLNNFTKQIIGNPYATFLISLDGLDCVNDHLRGEGVYEKVIANLKDILKRPARPYIGVQFTVQPENVHQMHDFCKYMAGLGVDWILFNLTWFVTKQEAHTYEQVLRDNFSTLAKSHRGYMFDYDLDNDVFIKEQDKINNGSWPIQISCYLREKKDIGLYTKSLLSQSAAKHCYKQWMRMDIMPDGKVTPCSQFPDLRVGDLRHQTTQSVWKSREYQKFRSLIKKELLPVCKKCDCLYLYNDQRKIL